MGLGIDCCQKLYFYRVEEYQGPKCSAANVPQWSGVVENKAQPWTLCWVRAATDKMELQVLQPGLHLTITANRGEKKKKEISVRKGAQTPLVVLSHRCNHIHFTLLWIKLKIFYLTCVLSCNFYGIYCSLQILLAWLWSKMDMYLQEGLDMKTLSL